MTTKNHKAQWLRDNLKKGEVYAGLLLGQNGEADHHLILLPGKAARLDWKAAVEWAKKAGGELPNRRELRLLWVNAKSEFEDAWYWSGEQLAAYPDSAWYQDFDDGNQYNRHKYDQLRARAVRRLPLE